MMFKTHLVFGFLVGLLAIKYFSVKNQILFMILVLFFSFFPDIDDYRSKISRKFGVFRFLIKFLFKHRGFFHSIFIPALVFLIFFLVNIPWVGFAVLLGYFSHLFLDMLTRQGVAFLYPLTRKRINGIFVTNGFVDYGFLFVFSVLSLYILITSL